jgi:hypothetical protein
MVERGGTPLVQYHAGGAGVDDLEQMGLSEGVWEVAGDWVRCFVWSTGPFIGRSVEEQGDQKLAGSSVLAAFGARSGHGGHARVLGGCWLGRGVLWVSSGEGRAVGIVQGRRSLGGGPGRISPPSSPSHGLGWGWGSWARPWCLPGAWLQRWSEPEQWSTQWFGLGLIASASVRQNARKSLKFKFLKFSSLGDHHIGQGILLYFCFKEINFFAKILISNLVKSQIQIQTLAQVWVMLWFEFLVDLCWLS